MKVLQLNTLPAGKAFGGAEKTVQQVATALTEHGHSVVSLGLRPRGSSAKDESGATRVWPVPNLAWPLSMQSVGTVRRLLYHVIDLFNPVAFGRLWFLVRTERPNVVLCHNLKGWSTAPWLVSRLTRVPIVQVLHDFGTICPRAQQYARGRACNGQCLVCRPRRAISRICWPGGTIVSVSTDCLLRHERSGVFRGAKGFVVNPILDPGRQSPAVVSTEPTYRYGFLGRIEESKGIEMFLQAASDLGERVLIGGVGNAAYVRKLQAQYPATADWLGWTEPDAVLARVRCLVVPSLWPEPFGRVVHEAAEAGVPVLLSDIGGLPEAAGVSGARVMLFLPVLSGLKKAMATPTFRTLPRAQTAGPTLMDIVVESASNAVDDTR